MTLRFASKRTWFALAALSTALAAIAVPAHVAAQKTTASDAAKARGAIAPKPDELTVELTIPTDSPHPCSVDKLQVTTTLLVVSCKNVNKHDGDKILRYAYSLRNSGAHMMLDALSAARSEKKAPVIEFDTDTKKNLEGCAKKECRNILSVTW